MIDVPDQRDFRGRVSGPVQHEARRVYHFPVGSGIGRRVEAAFRFLLPS